MIKMQPQSRACQTCKLRRIKCDGTKPTCNRCVKSRRTCIDATSYKQACFSIHLENSYASGTIKRPRGPRASLTTINPSFDLQSRALEYYLNYHSAPIEHEAYSSGCLSDSLSAWRTLGTSSAMVDLALSTLALATFSKCHNYAPAATEASVKYCRLLRVAHKRICQLSVQPYDQQSVDACLLTVLLMGRYEGVTHRPSGISLGGLSNPVHKWLHFDGAIAILEIWRRSRHYYPPSHFVTQTRRGLISTWLLRNLPIPDWMLDGGQFGEQGRALAFDAIAVKMTNLSHKTSELRKKKSPASGEIEMLLEEAVELDKALQNWAVQVSSESAPKILVVAEPGPWPKRHIYSPTVYGYSSASSATIWSRVFGFRLLVSNLAVSILNSAYEINGSYEPQRQDFIAQAKTMAHNIASSVPFSLGLLRLQDEDSTGGTSQVAVTQNQTIRPQLAATAIWHLVIASMIETVDLVEKSWFRRELAYLGRVLGDGVLECAVDERALAL